MKLNNYTDAAHILTLIDAQMVPEVLNIEIIFDNETSEKNNPIIQP